MRRYILVLVILLQIECAQAVLNGDLVAEQQVATIQIVASKNVWNHVYGKLVEEHSFCSAVVVGKAPVTVLTAAHCLRDVDMLPGHLPKVTLLSTLQPELNRLPLRLAIYTDYSELEQHLDKDLAVLVFAANLSELSTLPVVMQAQKTTGIICGYGGLPLTGAIAPTCAVKPMIANPNRFEEILPQSYEASDALFYQQQQTQFASKNSALSALDSLLAVNRLDSQGHYSLNVPMPVKGDSGGAWLIKNARGEYGLIAITSFIESFYRKNIAWEFFADKTTPQENFSYVAYGLRLDAMPAQSILQEAQAQGADIRILPAKQFLHE